jgi:hypothetical protein
MNKQSPSKKLKVLPPYRLTMNHFGKTLANKTVDLATCLEAQQTYDAKQFNDSF